MKKKTTMLLLAAALAALAASPAQADFELKDDKGRRILLKDDGTWKYLDAAAPAAAAAAAAEAPKEQAELRLERRLDAPGGCRYELALHNGMSYAIRSLVPEFQVLRTGGVAYSSQMLGFGPVRPGDTHRRAVQFPGIVCADIERLQVQGGDRCEMGELNKFSDAAGQCLARVRLVGAEGLGFEKTPVKSNDKTK